MKSQGSTLKHRYLIQQRELFGDRLYTGLDGSNFFVDKEEITTKALRWMILIRKYAIVKNASWGKTEQISSLALVILMVV